MNVRLETFCDGVIAIAITLLIIEINVPPIDAVHSAADVWRQLGQLWPSFFAFTLSFIIILIAWMGHHNLLKNVTSSSSQFQLANGFLLFTIVLMPFTTAFMADYLNTPYAQPAIFVYCLNTLLHNVGWNLLHRSIYKPVPLIADKFLTETILKASRGARYGFILYAAITALAWWQPYPALILNVLTWTYWLILALRLRMAETEK